MATRPMLKPLAKPIARRRARLSSLRCRHRDQVRPAPSKIKFDAAFIESRMREHSAWKEREAQRLGIEIIAEIREVLGDEARFR